jgi:hypothetical protein
VTEEKIADDAITSRKIKDETITSVDIGSGQVRTEDISDGAVTLAKLGADVSIVPLEDGSVTNTKLADGAVSTTKIGNSEVTEDKIREGSISSLKLKDGAVTAAKIATNAVTAAKIASNAVGTSEIKDGAVTPEKLSFAAGFSKYVPRAVATWDKTRMNFEFDGVLHEDGMDLAGIVPAGAVATHLIIEVSGPQGESFQIYANQGTKICNSFIGFIQGMGGGLGRVHCVIYNDPDRLFDYLLTSGIGDVVVAVAGWFI